MEYKLMTAIWSILLTWTVLKTTADPGGSVIVRLNSLHNPDNKNYKNKCCDGTSGRSCGPCACQLEIWVNCDGKRNDTDCFYGYTKTGVFPRSSHVIFNGTLGNGESNPLVYNFSLFKGTFGYQIEATEGSSVKIDDYKRHVPLYPSNHFNRKWTNLTQTSSGASGSSLDVSYSVFCNAHYYGPSCIVGCPPGKTYKCDPNTGKKLCNAGWLGPNCDCRMTHKNTCGPKGEKICYPPWYGDNCHVKCVAKNDRLAGYSCNRTTGGKICLSGWYGRGCNQTVAIVARTTGYVSNGIAMTSILSVATLSRVMSSASTFMTRQQASAHSELSRTKNITPVLTRSPPNRLSSCSYSCHMTSSIEASYWLTPDSVNTWKSTEMILSGSTRTIRMSPILPPDSTHSGFQYSSTVQTMLTSEQRNSQEMKSVSERINNTITEKHKNVEQTIKFNLSATTTPFPLDQSPSQGITTESKGLNNSRNTAEFHSVEQSKPQLSTTTTHLRIPEEYTVKEEQGGSEPLTKPEATATTGNSITNASMRRTYSITSTITEEATTREPGPSENKTRDDIWWLVLLCFVGAALLILAAMALIRKKTRKRRNVCPQYEVPPRELELQTGRATENDKIHSDRNILKVMPMANDQDEWNTSKALPVGKEI